jgi:hypothetical protein
MEHFQEKLGLTLLLALIVGFFAWSAFPLVNSAKSRSYTRLVKRLLQSCEDTSRNRWESGWTFLMYHADELLSPNVCKTQRLSLPTGCATS